MPINGGKFKHTKVNERLEQYECHDFIFSFPFPWPSSRFHSLILPLTRTLWLILSYYSFCRLCCLLITASLRVYKTPEEHLCSSLNHLLLSLYTLRNLSETSSSPLPEHRCSFTIIAACRTLENQPWHIPTLVASTLPTLFALTPFLSRRHLSCAPTFSFILLFGAPLS